MTWADQCFFSLRFCWCYSCCQLNLMDLKWFNWFIPVSTVECWSEETGCEHGSFPSSSLLHAWICTPHQQRIPAVPCIDSTRTHPADVWCQEHDGCLWSKAWTLPDCGSHVPWPYVHEGGGWTDAQCSEQEQFLLCGMDPQQCEDSCLWHPTPWSEDGFHFRWKQHCHPGTVQAHQWTVHCYVQA